MNQKIQRGDIIDVTITGIQPYGAFALLDNGYSGLIHISEISEKFVKNIDNFVKVGEVVKVKVLDYDEEQQHAKLSLKAISKIRKRNRKVYYKNSRRLIVETPSGFSSLENMLDTWIERGIVEE